jgi:hypothetical protein
MRHPKIPKGFQYWTSEPDSDAAWRLAIEYKETREHAHCDVFVRVKVIRAAGTNWVLIRDEERTA